MHRFFPAVWFGWLWLALLLCGVLAAAYVDFRRYVIPRTLTIGLLVLGLVLQTVRGAWLGAQGFSVWLLPAGVFSGAVDGLLFALAGFATGFGLFFALWLLRTCGGGDVKLFAAIATWTGPISALWLLALSIVVVTVLATSKAIFLMLTGQMRQALPTEGRTESSRWQNRDRELSVQEMLQRGQKPKRLLSFSLPLAVSLVLLLAWKCPRELGLAPPSPAHSPVPVEPSRSP